MNIRDLINSEPEVGDIVEMELGDVLVETVIDEVLDDGVVIRVNEEMLTLMIEHKRKLNESIVFSDRKPRLSGLSFDELDRLSESAGTNQKKFRENISKNLSLPAWYNTLELFGVYARHLGNPKSLIKENHQTDIEKTMFDDFSEKTYNSIDSAKIGDSVSLLHLQCITIPNLKTFAKLDGFLQPKEIIDVKKVGDVQYLKFADGTQYPEAGSGEIFELAQTKNMTALFSNYDDAAEVATLYTIIGKQKSSEIDFDIRIDTKNQSVSEGDDPCWKNYKQVGMKDKDGREVPNCVPKESVEEGNDFSDIRPARVGDEIVLKNSKYRGVIVKLGTDGEFSFKNESDGKRYRGNTVMIDRNLSQENRYRERSDSDNKRFDDAIGSDMARIDKSGDLKKFGIGETSNYGDLDEAKYQGREVTLNQPMAGDVKKSKVYVKNAKGNVVKVNFGQKGVKIKKSNPKRRKSFRARHGCDNPGPKWKAKYWSCRAW